MSEDEKLMRARAKERDEAVDAIEHALRQIRDEGREPDDWELVDLTCALACLSRGIYRLAVIEADRALTPREERSSTPVKVNPEFRRFDLALLERALEEFRHEPVMPHAVFGKVILV